MKKTEVGCPNCGSVVEFTASVSLVSVCRSCGSIVARSDRKIEDHGKVAAIVPTDSVFHLGQTGRFREHPFEVIGRVQYQHPTGGLWEEWYIAYPNGRWGWLAEAQGKRYLTHARKITNHMSIPAWEDLTTGSSVRLGDDVNFSIQEFATAFLASAEGEIPFSAFPNGPHSFADLSGPSKGIATLAYKEGQVELFIGHEVTLGELGISPNDPKLGLNGDSQQAPIVKGLALNCPHCGGSVEMRAPDQSQRVTCSYCGSLLDIDGTNLRYLTTLTTQIKPLLPIGSTGTLAGTEFTVLGFVRRAVYFDAEYDWDEYLLYEKVTGFRWLVHSDLHWSFVEPADPPNERGQTVSYDGENYRLFQRAWARVLHVYGEFYWKVSVGDTVLMLDYISPPHMISIEKTPTVQIPSRLFEAKNFSNYKYSESNCSFGTYIPHEEVEKAFKVGPLRRGAAIAPNQPAPNYQAIFFGWVVFIFLLIGIDIFYSTVMKYTVAHAWTFIAIIILSLYPIAMLLHKGAFETSRWADSEFSPYNSNS